MTKIEKIQKIINAINDAKKEDDWSTILNELLPSKYQKDEQKYPAIHKLFNEEDLKKIPNTIEMDKLATPTEKILFALLWKNGDLLKIPHLIAGLKDEDNPSKTAMTFHQLGRFLRSRGETPIVDQHVIRAYKAIKHDNLDEAALSEITKSGLLNPNNDANWVKEYTTWITEKGNGSVELFYEIDNVMFAFGRMLKGGK